MGKCFLKLIDKHFPKHHKFRKLFNRNTVKVSYSCLPSMKAKINQHNRNVLRKKNEELTTNARTCNCPNNAICPMDGGCLEKDILYLAHITSDLRNYKTKEYKGICSTTWKVRYGNHKKTFNHEKYMKDTTLSIEVWDIKRKNGQHSITWKKDQNYPSYNPQSKKCSLCMHEKLEIALYKDDNLLNKRSEVVSKCLHRDKFKLINMTSDAIT